MLKMFITMHRATVLYSSKVNGFRSIIVVCLRLVPFLMGIVFLVDIVATWRRVHEVFSLWRCIEVFSYV